MTLDSLEDVRLFRQVVVSGGISAAARVLNSNKNRISQRLASLEQDLGVRLAHRTTRSFRLTEEGERFYASVEALLEAAERSELSVASTRAMEGRVRLALRSTMVGLGIGTEITQLMQVAPKLKLQLVVIDEKADLLAGGFDLAMQVGSLPDSSLVATRLGTVSVVLAAAPSYLDTHGRPRTPSDLALHQCIRKLGDEPEKTWPLVNRRGVRFKAAIGGSFECSDSQLQSEVLYAGLGIGLRPAEEVRRAEAAGRLERVLPSWEFAPVPVWAISPKGRLRLPRVALIVDLLKRVVVRFA
ncbi:MAG: LysR family transcriptional regulator [Holophagaceae bacterium]|nr:LysR family transcriptional regulator [Holophagaceae bacterium]